MQRRFRLIACGLSPQGSDWRRHCSLGSHPLAQQPGSGFLYGLNIDVLGFLVEVVSKKTLAEFLEGRLFTPLKMNDTKFFLNDADTSRLAQLYVRARKHARCRE